MFNLLHTVNYHGNVHSLLDSSSRSYENPEATEPEFRLENVYQTNIALLIQSIED